MSVRLKQTAFVAASARTVSLSDILSVSADNANPSYLIVNGLDRNTYTGSGGGMGTISGGGAVSGFAGTGGDGRGFGIIFTWDSATGSYRNSTYGNLLDLSYTSPGAAGALEDISFFGTNSLISALRSAPYADVMSSSPGTFTNFGTATFVTSPVAAVASGQATPGSVVAAALREVGATWNMNGGWMLASTIAANAGAGLNVATNTFYTPGAANGEWKVAYNGPVSPRTDWQSSIRAGDVVVYMGGNGIGQVATVVSGQGSSAKIVDAGQDGGNYIYGGTGQNIRILAPHAATDAFRYADPSGAVVYRLDAPAVTAGVSSERLPLQATQALSQIFSASDWAGTAITQYQAYATAAGDGFLVNGARNTAAHTAATAITFSSLSGVLFSAGTASGVDTISVRARNADGYWGDWTQVTVNVGGPPNQQAAAPLSVPSTPVPKSVAPSAPVLASQTPSQTFIIGRPVSLVLAANTFTDPQGQVLSYRATLANGAALPSWLKFDATARAFNGVVPYGAQPVTLKVLATDTSGLSASETFGMSFRTVMAPVLVKPLSPVMAYQGQSFSVSLAGNFSDPARETLTYRLTLSTGQPLPSWLKFNASTGILSGTAPLTPQTVPLSLTAINTDGASASAAFAAGIMADVPIIKKVVPSLNLAWSQKFSMKLPPDAFSDPAGQKLAYRVTQADGTPLPSWIRFDPSTNTLSGTAPTDPQLARANAVTPAQQQALAGRLVVDQQTLSMQITATNAYGQSATGGLLAFIRARNPSTTGQMPDVHLKDGDRVSIPFASYFTDPQNSPLTFRAGILSANSQATWLTLDTVGDLLKGTVPGVPGSGTQSGEALVQVKATNIYGLSAIENFAMYWDPTGTGAHLVPTQYSPGVSTLTL